jgi:hypothetical protein
LETIQVESVRIEIEGSVKAATWLTVADAGAVAVAYKLADELDQSTDVSQMVQLSRALQGMLTALGMTVAGRIGKAEPEEEVNPLENLRKRASAPVGRKQAVSKSRPTGS